MVLHGSLPHPLVGHPPRVGFLAQKHCNAWFLEHKHSKDLLDSFHCGASPMQGPVIPEVLKLTVGDGHHYDDTDQ